MGDYNGLLIIKFKFKIYITMVNKIDLLPDEEFKKLVETSSCVSDVLRKLGYSVKGNSWGYVIVNERMKKLNITFKRKLQKNSKKHIVQQIQLKEILTEDSNYNRTKLRERLIKEGLKENKCEICGISEWNNKPISLQLHHINGINNDNRLENLQILCPNCHSQTETFGTRGRGLIIQRKCDSLPLEDRLAILEAVRKFGIVEARKKLPYRNSLINSIVKSNRDIIIMIDENGNEINFNTTYEAAKYLYENYNIGSNINSSRSSISRCLNNRQQSIQGLKFIRRSLME